MRAALSLSPGSVAWLLRHELRLRYRGMGARTAGIALAVLLAASLVLHAVVYAVLGEWSGALPAWSTFVVGGVGWVLISLMLAQAIAMSVEALFDRGDLDLLLSSPLPTRNVFIARSMGIAVGVGSLSLFLLAPVANVALARGQPRLLAIYVALPALALAVTALGMALTLMLVRLLGARRARHIAQVLGALVGASLVLVTQTPGMLGVSAASLAARLAHWTLPGGALALDSPLWWPARALLGEPLPLLAVVATGLGGIALVVQSAHRRFLAGTQESVAGPARRAPPRAGGARFSRGLWRILLAKEWRLIMRDPQLITRTLLQLLYMVPAMLAVLRGGSPMPLLLPAIVFMASMLAGSLAWITVAAEDAPDLLAGSPCPQPVLHRAKLLAALLPVWLLMSPLLAVVPGVDLRAGLAFVGCLIGGTVAVTTAQIGYPRQGKRADITKRGQGHAVIGLIESLIAAAWAGTAYCLASAPRYTPLALLAAAAGSGAVWMLGRSRRKAAA